MKLFTDYSLENYNTFRMKSNADYFAEIEHSHDLPEIFADSELTNLPKHFLGKGSNLLLPEKIRGLVIISTMDKIHILDETDMDYLVEVESGAEWDDFIKWCVSKSIFGLENLTMIPGSAGAAPVQNVGAYGIEQKDFFLNCEVFDFHTGEFYDIEKDACCFDYRFSNFKKPEMAHLFITKVRYKLPKNTPPHFNYNDVLKYFQRNEINLTEVNHIDVFEAIREIRTAKLPNTSQYPNAGSFFKNPIIDKTTAEYLLSKFPDLHLFQQNENSFKCSAAFLIEQAGWKGFSESNAGVSEKHALILINKGNAISDEIKDLAHKIANSVEEQFGIKLEREVIYW
ncbi:MAG: UDP-N-acetylenolpyruvoylglucosamine reductase [Ignavibacteria bacterium GWF2_33_9]|nr:MAG: UDP-N-acetylenolpyruvoylglucosamine reductase [Ignavibacteria bacterium GWF2_33_9]